jgi:hypothetical protein
MMGPKFCLLITVSAFLIFPLVERATSAKQVQVMTGLHPGNKFLLKGQSTSFWIFVLFSVYLHLQVVVEPWWEKHLSPAIADSTAVLCSICKHSP